jgi:hypothetical protein
MPFNARTSFTGKRKMNETFTPQITELVSEPDNIEKLRDHVAVLLKGETQNQYKLAKETFAKSAEDYNFKVFIENTRPYDVEDEPPETPLINVMLQKAAPMDGNPRIGAQKEKATFIIDCIAFGNDGGETWNDKVAAARAWKAARVIRTILMSEQYAYLGLRGLVGSRIITSIETGVPENGGAALAIVTARIIFEVQFMERAINAPGAILEGIDFTLDPSSGEVLINED